MTTLLYGTRNPAKLAVMKRRLFGLDLVLVGLMELGRRIPEAEETGDSPLENAKIKAKTYRDATGMLTLATDSALYIEGLSAPEQPAAHARRMQGTRMDDEAMTQYYAALLRTLGGKAVARYRNALCIAFPDGRLYTRFDDSVASEPFYLVDTPHERRTPGFPLDALSVEIASGRYYNDLQEANSDSDLAQEGGYCRFVREILGLPA